LLLIDGISALLGCQNERALLMKGSASEANQLDCLFAFDGNVRQKPVSTIILSLIDKWNAISCSVAA
jgi:hypothetical protein